MHYLLLTKNENLLLGGGGPKTVTQMLVTLSVDHRVYDGETGGGFFSPQDVDYPSVL